MNVGGSPGRYPLLQNRDWLAARLAEGMFYSEIAAAVGDGCTKYAVRYWRRRHGLD